MLNWSHAKDGRKSRIIDPAGNCRAGPVKFRGFCCAASGTLAPAESNPYTAFGPSRPKANPAYGWSKRPTDDPQPLKILYVEDNEVVREVTAELLAQDKRQIVACASAEAALEEFRKSAFDIVITDVSLPVMSGIEFARSLLSLKPRLPIILASGYALDFALENWGSNVRAIIKPFEPSEIEALISDLTAG